MRGPEPDPAEAGRASGTVDGVVPGAIDLIASARALNQELLAFRRDLHAHPETGRREVRTTARVAQRLKDAGLEPVLLPGTGLLCDIGDPEAPAVALRADLDALPVPDLTGLPWASQIPGVAHACGHDVHTTVVLGAGLVLARMPVNALPHRIRLVFQPAEELTPGGAQDVIAAGALDGVRAIYALHCDPRLDAGCIGTRIGPITSAADHVLVRLRGPGGHTSRPHLTGDLVYALAQVATVVPAALCRRVDPRAVVNLTWGRIEAGRAPNAIPAEGLLEGTLRSMDTGAWETAAALVPRIVAEVVAPFGVEAEVTVTSGVPPVDNSEGAVAMLEMAAGAVLGEGAVLLTAQSLGGEDFAWYLRQVPGAMARLGTRTPGGHTFDLHQGDLVVDERAIDVGVRLLAATALATAVDAEPLAEPGPFPAPEP
ncbi:MAG: amidohydrolase [Actinomycetales bacterium]|nr:amidohydrolase [Actinomycetales bacterium]